MLFHSIAFFYFFTIIYTVSFLLNILAHRFKTSFFIFRINKIFLLGGSYYFYAFWDVRFLALIIISTLVDFWVGPKGAKEDKTKRVKLVFSIKIWCFTAKKIIVNEMILYNAKN